MNGTSEWGCICGAVAIAAVMGCGKAEPARGAVQWEPLSGSRDPVAVIIGGPWAGPAPLDVYLDATTSRPATDGGWIQAFSWDLGDGTQSANGYFTHAYSTPGNYTVTLKVTDGSGNVGAAQQVISVNGGGSTGTAGSNATSGSTGSTGQGQQPVAVILGGPFSGEPPLDVYLDGTTSFTRSSSGWIQAFSWNLGDGSTSAAGYLTHTYAVAGTYTVTLTATDGDGVTATATQVVQVGSGSSTGGGTIGSSSRSSATTGSSTRSSSTGSSGTRGSTGASSTAGTTGAARGGGSVDAGGLADWTFYGTENGGPQAVYGVTSDQDGNVWVAGGEEGLFLLQPGSSTFRKLTMADGLHPYGYLPDGGVPPRTYLNVISVAGGPPGVVFVGYAGMPPAQGELDCESNWDGPTPDPSIYKSGDADRVTLSGTKISVVHYDIFSGPGVVAAEPQGREKLCNILRIAYDPGTGSVWFGGNHGFAWGDPTYAGDPTCDGQLSCSGVQEHAHPAINGWSDDSETEVVLLTDGYYGLSVDPGGDVWVGGQIRSTHFRYASNGDDFWTSESETEEVANHIDIWPDPVTEPNIPTPDQRVDDNVSGMASMPDGTLWVSSFTQGVAHLDSSGNTLQLMSSGLVEPESSSIRRDPLDGSIWVGASWDGITRIQNGTPVVYDWNLFGPDLVNGPITDIQSDNWQGKRRMLVAFGGSAGTPGAIGIYTGP